jgi:hypothetical protein
MYQELKNNYDVLMEKYKVKEEECETMNSTHLLEMQSLSSSWNGLIQQHQQEQETSKKQLFQLKVQHTNLEMKHQQVQDQFVQLNIKYDEVQNNYKETDTSYKQLQIISRDESKKKEIEKNELQSKIQQYEKELNIKNIQLDAKDKIIVEKQAECLRLSNLGEGNHKLKLELSVLEADHKWNKEIADNLKLTNDTIKNQLEVTNRKYKEMERQLMVETIKLSLLQQQQHQQQQTSSSSSVSVSHPPKLELLPAKNT